MLAAISAAVLVAAVLGLQATAVGATAQEISCNKKSVFKEKDYTIATIPLECTKLMISGNKIVKDLMGDDGAVAVAAALKTVGGSKVTLLDLRA